MCSEQARVPSWVGRICMLAREKLGSSFKMSSILFRMKLQFESDPCVFGTELKCLSPRYLVVVLQYNLSRHAQIGWLALVLGLAPHWREPRTVSAAILLLHSFMKKLQGKVHI